MSEELAIVKGVGFGLRDVGRPILWFGVETMCGGSLQVFEMDQIDRVLTSAEVYDIKSLEGRACIVSNEGTRQLWVRWK